MAPNLRGRVRAGVGTFQEWLDDRDKDIAQGKAEVEAAARRFYGDTTRRAERAVTHVASDVRGLIDGVRAAAPKKKTPTQAQVASGRPAKKGSEGWRTSATASLQKAQDLVQRIADGEPARKVAGDAARGAGNVAGLGTGALQTAEDLKDGVVFVSRLLDPYDRMRSAPGDAAHDHVYRAAGTVIDYGRRVVADPRRAAHEIAEMGRQARRDLDPSATRPATSFAGEVERNFKIGQKQGEAAAEVASWFVGGPAAKTAAGLGKMSKAARVAKHLDEDFPPRKAEYLADLYKGKGHHAFLKERTRLPQFLGGGPLPRWALDNPFNVLKPAGISRGEMYELHSRVDPFFYGAGLPRRVGGGGWSSKRLGIGKYDALGRVYHGTPGATKAVAGGAAVTGGAYLNEELEGER